MKSQDIISIIAPAYNHEKYVLNALSSIAKQTYYNKELIIIDDCSTDNTADLIQSYISRKIVKELFPAGIQYIRHSANMNAHRTINEGISVANGKYISIINTDDAYEPNRLDTMLNCLKKRKARIAFSKVRCIDANGDNIPENPFEDLVDDLEKYPLPSFALAVKNVAVGTGNFIFEKDLYEEIGGFSPKYHFIHDWDFILKATLLSEPAYVEDTYYLYRFHSTNTIKQIDESPEMEQKKNDEVKQVLYNYLSSIFNGNTMNPILQDLTTWNYFMNIVNNEYCSFLWKEIQKKEQYGV